MIPALLGKPTKPFTNKTKKVSRWVNSLSFMRPHLTLLSIVNSRRAEAPTSLQSLTQHPVFVAPLLGSGALRVQLCPLHILQLNGELTAFKEGLAMIYITG